MFNSFGLNFTITSFGESHGAVIGIIIDGCPSGLKVDYHQIQNQLNRRRPGQNDISTPRVEKDNFEIISGILNDFTTGAPICMLIKNKDADSSKYEIFKIRPRPSHADYTATQRYGKYVDIRGGGRFSGRNTAGFVMAGSIAKQLLEKFGIEFAAYTRSINTICDESVYNVKNIRKTVESNNVRTVKQKFAILMEEKILEAKRESDSVGGIITCVIEGIPPGIGNPIFNSLESRISAGIFSIPGVKGVEFGAGFKATEMYGSEHNDAYEIKNSKIVTKTNNAGGIIGGITTGMPIKFNVAIKPTASIGKEQNTVNLTNLSNSSIIIEGRHDPCIVPRAVPVVESLSAVVLVDVLMGHGFIPKVLSG